MKTSVNVKSGANPASTHEPRPAGLRLRNKPIEHRHERRKIRGQLRRLDWALSVEDELFA